MELQKLIAGLLIITFGLGCSPNVHLSDTTPLSMPDKASEVIMAQNGFAFKLFHLIAKADQTASNKMISPLSVYMDLSMVYNGAAGKTREAIRQTLQLGHIDTIALNKTSQALLTNLPQADPKVQLDLANALWYRNSLNPLPAFLKTNQNYYHAEIQPADFSDPQTTAQINDWAARHTQQKIKSIVDHINPSEVMFLLNAVYFNGKWQQSFDPEKTRKRDFHTSQQVKQVPFMYREAKYNYGQTDSLQVVELPYGNGSFSMYVLLPAENIKVNALIASLNPASFSRILNRMDSSKVKLYLPKWESAYSIDDLTPELSKMGMGIAFGPNADFTRMYKNNQTQISKVIHKTYIRVNEEGTEAAAVTSIGVKLTAFRPGYPPVMNVNRPFVYVIMAKKSRSILFLGTVNDPEEKI